MSGEESSGGEKRGKRICIIFIPATAAQHRPGTSSAARIPLRAAYLQYVHKVRVALCDHGYQHTALKETTGI